VLDENLIIARLALPISMEAVSAMRAAAAGMVMDAWDRNAIRDPFQNILTTAMPLNDNLSRLETLFSVLAVMKAGALTEDHLCDSIRFLAGMIDAGRRKAIDHMTKLAECSEDDDPIH